MRPIAVKDYRMLAAGDPAGAMAFNDGLALLGDPLRWLEPTPTAELFRAWRALLDREAIIEHTAGMLGPMGFKAQRAAHAVMMLTEQTQPEMREDFELVLRGRASDDDFNPFAPVAEAAYAVQSQPIGLDGLSTRAELLKGLMSRADVYHSYIAGYAGSFWDAPRSEQAEQDARAVIIAIAAAQRETDAALAEAAATARTQEREEARARAERATKAREEAAEVERRAAARRADLEAEERAARLAAGMAASGLAA